ncbi:MAG: EAL domain-containing protein, partial [Gammaproteobacteria bacterium]|nr:EAL domain-containing protein [Gammaproteobacteria bacterium]
MPDRVSEHVIEKPKTLLLVDDELQVCEGLRRILYRDGYTIHVADGAERAMELLSEHRVDVIVSDQRMPRTKGTEFLARVRDAYPDTVRMILSGAADVEEVARAMESGAIYKFLTKPIDPALLRANVGEAFSRAASLQWSAAAAPASDAATGLATRARLEWIFRSVAARARREGRSVCMLMLKIDQYDNVLSSFGNSFGRIFLRAVGRTLDEAFGRSHVVAHDTPGTFLLLTSSPSPVDAIAGIDDEVDRLFERPLTVGDRQMSVTVSIGATAADGEVAFDELVDQTYAAMKTGSERGGATMQIFQPHLISAFRGQLELESDLRQGLKRRSFLLYYQPQVNLESGRIVGLEALLRWPHPARGFVSPSEFVPMAERLGLIGDIGGWVLDTAVAQLVAWQGAGLLFDELSINVSALQL